MSQGIGIDNQVGQSPSENEKSATSATAELLVDPVVSHTKFERELERYRLVAADCRRKGWWILDAEFPNVLVAFVPPQLRPRPVAFSVLINFDNYDLWAPSVRLVDPFTKETLRARELPPSLNFARRIPVNAPVEVPGIGPIAGYMEQPLLMNHGADELPFLCIPGVREYHNHPAHSGDDWLLHRDRGEGTLYFIIEKLARYGLEPIRGFDLGIQIVGLGRGEAPE